MPQDKLSDYLQYHYTIKRLLLLGGLWPDENPHIFYRLLPYPFLFANFIVIIGAINHMKKNFSNVAAVTKGMGTMMSFMTISLKVICVLMNRRDAMEVHKILDHHFEKLLHNQELATSILKNLRSFRRLTWVFIFFGSFFTILTFVTPVLSLIHQYRHSIDPIVYPLLYATSYPWPLDPPGFVYKIHFLIELIALLPYFCVSLSMDSLFMMYGLQMMGQFREMSHRIMHIEEMDDDRNGVQQCVAQHQSIMRCRDILQKIFGPILLWVVASNAISLCSSTFQLTQVKIKSFAKMLIFATYISFKVLQTFIYAFTGTCLTTESELYQKAVYNANWHTNRRFMSSILIMLAQKPIILTACNFSEISLNIFVKVLNTTMSYFFLLRTVS